MIGKISSRLTGRQVMAAMFGGCFILAAICTRPQARATIVTPDTPGWFCAANGGCEQAVTNECLDSPGKVNCDHCDGLFTTANQCVPSFYSDDSCDYDYIYGDGNIIDPGNDGAADKICGPKYTGGFCDNGACVGGTRSDHDACNLTFCYNPNGF